MADASRLVLGGAMVAVSGGAFFVVGTTWVLVTGSTGGARTVHWISLAAGTAATTVFVLILRQLLTDRDGIAVPMAAVGGALCLNAGVLATTLSDVAGESGSTDFVGIGAAFVLLGGLAMVAASFDGVRRRMGIETDG